MIDYKIHKIIEKDGKKIVVYRIYEGEVTTENESLPQSMKPTPVKRYRRTKLLGEKHREYTTDLDTREQLNKELDTEAKRLSKEVIDEQKHASVRR